MRIERLEWDGADPAAFAARIRGLAPAAAEIGAAAAEIVAAVRERGDAAIRELGERFGEPAPAGIRVDPGAVAAAPEAIEPELAAALRAAAANVTAVAEAELAALGAPAAVGLEAGQRIEVRTQPVAAAGLYVPGGRAAYPSSVLMGAIPARVAGVGRIAVATPPGEGGTPAPAVLAACALAGVDEVYAVGGAQAIAALAFGTQTVAAVDVIAGPGNRYVNEAKRIVFGRVGIDGIAGPSELLVVVDADAEPGWVALDLCAQAEHGVDSPLAVVSADADLLEQLASRVEGLAAERPTVAEAPLALVLAPDLDAALRLADAYAPEHLQLCFAGAGESIARDRVAGAVFTGSGAATAFGDYVAGSNHILPTGGAARFGGPLGPATFIRRTSVVSIPAEAAAGLAPHVATLAKAEGLPVHGESAAARTEARL